MKGTYLLIFKLQKNTNIVVGKLGEISFKKGYYVYIGSALNGLQQRIQRHLRIHKKKHWHIDYLLPSSYITSVFYQENNKREECNIAQTFKKKFHSISQFGSSDCSCNSHLFHGNIIDIMSQIRELNMHPYPIKEKILIK
jgi:Uri superfamily endonuclease